MAMTKAITKLLSHSSGLVLVDTRKRGDNREYFRHRTPLHIADIWLVRVFWRTPNRNLNPDGREKAMLP